MLSRNELWTHVKASRDLKVSPTASTFHERFTEVSCCDSSSRRRVRKFPDVACRNSNACTPAEPCSTKIWLARTEDFPEGNDRYFPEQRRKCFESLRKAQRRMSASGSLVLERQLRRDVLVDCTDEFAQRKADDAVTAASQWRAHECHRKKCD